MTRKAKSFFMAIVERYQDLLHRQSVRKLACIADDADNNVNKRLAALLTLDQRTIDIDDMTFVGDRMHSILAHEERPMLRRTARDILDTLADMQADIDDARSRRAFV